MAGFLAGDMRQGGDFTHMTGEREIMRLITRGHHRKVKQHLPCRHRSGAGMLGALTMVLLVLGMPLAALAGHTSTIGLFCYACHTLKASGTSTDGAIAGSHFLSGAARTVQGMKDAGWSGGRPVGCTYCHSTPSGRDRKSTRLNSSHDCS
jgi:hypothetical protein